MSVVHIWYAAFGSNLLEERFLTYLRGGPVPGAGRVQEGARDDADPVENRPFVIDRVLSFAGYSESWGGGVAFVDPHKVVAGDTLGRAWLITTEQLADVWTQENGGTTAGSDLDVDVEALASAGFLDLGRGWYRRLEYLGTLDGVAVATITCEELPEPHRAGDPYVEVVGRGVLETWDRSVEDVADYLATRPGNAGNVTAAEVAAILTRS